MKKQNHGSKSARRESTNQKHHSSNIRRQKTAAIRTGTKSPRIVKAKKLNDPNRKHTANSDTG
jgi:hypothetical protein